MKYYSSMTLSDYVAANWLEMDPNVVRLIEQEASLLEDAREEAEAWWENYEDICSQAMIFKLDLQNLIDEYSFARISFDKFFTEICSLVRNTEFGL